MFTPDQIQSYLQEMENQILNLGNRKKVELSRVWANTILSKPGTYAAFENGKVVYVGETGNMRERMKDLLDSRHHTLRRNIGRYNFSKLDGYHSANSKEKFPPHIEEKVISWLTDRITISVLATDLGRKELEERLIEKFHPIYNEKEKRKSN